MQCCQICARAIFHNYFTVRLCTTSINLCFGCMSFRIDAFIRCSIQLTLSILLYAVISNAINLRLSAAFIVHVSHLDNFTGHVKAATSLCLGYVLSMSRRSFHTPEIDLITDIAMPNLDIVALLHSPVSVNKAHR